VTVLFESLDEFYDVSFLVSFVSASYN